MQLWAGTLPPNPLALHPPATSSQRRPHPELRLPYGEAISISSSIAESTVNHEISRRMVTKQQMRCHRWAIICSRKSALASSTTTPRLLVPLASPTGPSL